MSHILALLKEVRARPGMYIGAASLTRLAAFLRGFELAAERFGSAKPDDFLQDFRDWIHQRCGMATLSWEDTILKQSTGEADGLKRFWDFLDEYLVQRQGKYALPEVQFTGPKEQFR